MDVSSVSIFIYCIVTQTFYSTGLTPGSLKILLVYVQTRLIWMIF